MGKVAKQTHSIKKKAEYAATLAKKGKESMDNLETWLRKALLSKLLQ